MKFKKMSVGSWLLVILGLVLAVRQAASMVRLYKAGERVLEAQQELSQAQIENAQLKDRLAQVENPQFLEKEAREKLGLGREGETTLILPNSGTTRAQTVEHVNEPNWKKWWDLYIRI